MVMGLSLFMGAVYINGAAYGILFLFGRVLPLRPFLYLIVPAYAATLYSMRRKKSGYFGVVKAILWQILPVWIILRIPNLSMAISVEVTFMILLSIAVWKEWFEVNRKRTLITLWSLVILLPAAGIGLFVKLDYVANYQMARLSAFIHPESNDGTLWGMIRNMISGAHLAGRGDCEKIKFFNRDYMLTFIIHYYGIFAVVLIIAIVGGILIWFLQKTGHQKNQLGMIMGTPADGLCPQGGHCRGSVLTVHQAVCRQLGGGPGKEAQNRLSHAGRREGDAAGQAPGGIQRPV